MLQRLFLILVLLLISGCSTKTYYVRDKTGKIRLTLIIYTDDNGNSYTAVTNGKWNSSKTPDSYLRVRNYGLDHWYALVLFSGDTTTIYEPYDYFDEINTGGTLLKLREMKDTVFAKIFFHEPKTKYIKIEQQ